MENQKKAKKNNIRILLIILCICIVILAAVLIAAVVKNVGKIEDTEETNDTNVISTVEQQIQDEEAFTIETVYGNLYYPKKWEPQLRTEIVEEENYTVKFYGVVEDKEEQHLFSLVFGDNGSKLGSLEKDGEIITVSIAFEETSMDENWSDDEKKVIYAMQEDINYLIGMWEKEGFSIAE